MSQGLTRDRLIIAKTELLNAIADTVLFVKTDLTLGDDANLTFDGTDLGLGSSQRFRMQAQNRIRYLNSMAKVYKSANQAITTGVATVVTFNTEAFDTDGLHDNATNNSRLTAALTGKYIVGAQVQWDVTTLANVLQGSIYKNGAQAAVLGTVAPTGAGAGTGAIQTSSMILSLVATDYVELVVNHDHGSNLNIIGSVETNTSFWMIYVGE